MASHSALSYIGYSVQKRNEEKESPEIQRRLIAELTQKYGCGILPEIPRTWASSMRASSSSEHRKYGLLFTQRNMTWGWLCKKGHLH